MRSATMAASGSQAIPNTVVATLRRTTTAVTGEQSQTGTATATLQQAAMGASGSQSNPNTVISNLQKATASASGLLSQTGSVIAALKRATIVAAGSTPISGSASMSLQKATFSGLSTHGILGILLPTLRRATASLSGSHSTGYSQLTGITYSQSTVYPGTNAATELYMNNGSADGSNNDNQTGTEGSSGEWIKADLGSSKYVDYIVIGYDYLTNLANGPWGTPYTDNAPIEGSTNNTSWTSEGTAPTYASSGSSNGLVSVNIGASYRYIRILGNSNLYLALLEFQIWGTP